MRTRQTLLQLALSLSAIWLTACNDGGSETPMHTMCNDAGCDSAETHDGAADDDESASDPTDVDAPPDEGGDTHDSSTPGADAAGGDAGTGEVDASPGSDVDAQTTPDEHDAGTNPQVDAGTTPDAHVTPDASVTPDAGSSNNDAGATFVPVRFSASDHGASAYLSADRLSVENRGEDMGNARSDSAITPGSGVFYFEAHREIDTVGFYGVGIATASASLTTGLGTSPALLGIFTHGDFADGALTCTGQPGFADPELKRDYGLVIDYRGASPRVLYVLEGSSGVEIRHTCTTAITAPVHIVYSGARWEVGYQISINTGADTTNHPFHFSESQIKGALTAASEASAAGALVLGFGKTRALPLSADPVLNFPTDLSVAPGASVTLTGTASDTEDGNLTAKIEWVDISSQHHAPVKGTGGSFTFSAALGRHPVLMSVTDSVGRTVRHQVMVTAAGTPTHQSQVRLVGAPMDPLASGPPESVISADGLSVDLHAAIKKGVRCNQAIYGQYWYFEATRNGAPANEGVGLMIPDGNLNPYDFVNVPWSMSINLTGSTWYNLNSIDDWTASNTHYGFAVDYRGLHPIVHVIIGGALHHTLVMKDVWGPIHPIVYGNPSYDAPNVDPGNDISVNFGADLNGHAFQFNPAVILTNAGVNVDTLVLGWGR